MTRDELLRKKSEIENTYGVWTASDIHLGHGVSSMPATPQRLSPQRYMHEQREWPGYSPTSARIRRIVQIIADLAGHRFDMLRILDLGCLEGAFSVELASRGARVVGVDGREPNIAKARFAADVLDLKTADFRVDDVRKVTPAHYGRFDVVLCLGLLYHLDAPDIFRFLEEITACCGSLLIVETELALWPDTAREHAGRQYYGTVGREHDPSSSQEERRKALWMSLDNANSFLFTRFSLYNLLSDLGYSSAYESVEPAVVGHGARSTFVAVKGQPIALATAATPPPTERYAEVSSGRRDSELHEIRRHPLFRLHRFLKSLRVAAKNR